jgi:hypothetical protein
MKHILLYTFLLLSTLLTYAQKENNIWYLGIPNGLDFNNGSPQWIDMQANAMGGGAAVADSSGNLQFYTNGRVILGKDHSIMPNSVYIDAATCHLGAFRYFPALSGVSQLAIVQPHIDQPLYYLFYKTAFTNFGNLNPLASSTHAIYDSVYLAYSLIDMRLNNGNGDVVASLNNIAIDTLGSTHRSNPSICAVGGKCNTWLLYMTTQYRGPGLHQFDMSMNVLSINQNGAMQRHASFDIGNYNIGNTKHFIPSPSGNMINLNSGNANGHNILGRLTNLKPTDTAYHCSVLNFDKNTGILSNPRKRGLSKVVFFSPKGSKLLSMVAQEDTTFNPIVLQQFDTAFLGDNDAIAANTETLDISSLPELMLTGYDYRDLQGYEMRTGPDGKTYINFTIHYYNKIHQPAQITASEFLYCLIALKDADQGLSLNNIEVIAAGEQLAPFSYTSGIDSFERGAKPPLSRFGEPGYGWGYILPLSIRMPSFTVPMHQMILSKPLRCVRVKM